jgi:hypothetical protein
VHYKAVWDVDLIHDGLYGGMADMAMEILFEKIKEISIS